MIDAVKETFEYPNDHNIEINDIPDYKYDIQCSNGCHVQVASLKKQIEYFQAAIEALKRACCDIDRKAERTVISDMSKVDQPFADRLKMDEEFSARRMGKWRIYPHCTKDCFTDGECSEHKNYAEGECGMNDDTLMRRVM